MHERFPSKRLKISLLLITASLNQSWFTDVKSQPIKYRSNLPYSNGDKEDRSVPLKIINVLCWMELQTLSWSFDFQRRQQYASCLCPPSLLFFAQVKKILHRSQAGGVGWIEEVSKIVNQFELQQEFFGDISSNPKFFQFFFLFTPFFGVSVQAFSM